MKNKARVIFAVMLVIAGLVALGFMGYSMAKAVTAHSMGNQARAELVGEAPKDSFEGFEALTAGDDGFNVGINVYGKIIFADNDAAFHAVKEKCAKAIEEMRSQAPELGRFSESNIYSYYNYIWQINWEAVDQNVYFQSRFLNKFLEYYKNGDPKQGSASRDIPAYMSGAVANLLKQCESTDLDRLKKKIKSIYDSNVSEMLIANKPIMLHDQISNEKIKDAVLSDPIPVFGPRDQYKKGEDFKSKLRLCGWDIVVSSEAKPIAVFSLGKPMGEYAYQYTLGEEYAIVYNNAISRLKAESTLVLFLGEYFFVADDTDTVLPVLSLDDTTGEPYPTRSFSEFNAAVNKSIDYYSGIDPEDVAIGGNVILMDALYGDQKQ